MSIKYKIIFWGTPIFADLILKKLIKSEFKPFLLITMLDQPVGRKQILTPPPVKITAEKNNITVWQLKSLSDQYFQKKLLSLSADLFIVASYGLILPQVILNMPKFGSINVHPSFLPKYRGATPIQSAIIAGETKIGASIVLMDSEVDHGKIITQKETEIEATDTTETLMGKMANLSGDLLIKTLPDWFNKKIIPCPQDHNKATFTHQIKKEEGKINWNKSAQEIERIIRAYCPWPSAYTVLDGKIVKIIQGEILSLEHVDTPGKIFLNGKNNLCVACGDDAIILKIIQPEGKKPLEAKSFLNGHQEIVGKILN